MKVSIITPCYNHGKYLDEMINSVEDTIKNLDYELIIVNDGSTDEFTINKLADLSEKGYNIIHQQNQGLGAARNKAISHSKGEYIVPLDADNKLNVGFVEKCVAILETQPQFDVVYTDCIFFGDKKGYSKVGEYNILKLIYDNYIDACAIYRKKAWEQYGGYDINMPAMGHEDWELWLRMSFGGAKFYYLPIPGFYYRVLSSSMLRSVTIPNKEKNIQYVFNKYKDYIIQYYRPLYELYSKHDWAINVYMKKNKLKSATKILFNKWNIS